MQTLLSTLVSASIVSIHHVLRIAKHFLVERPFCVVAHLQLFVCKVSVAVPLLALFPAQSVVAVVL